MDSVPPKEQSSVIQKLKSARDTISKKGKEASEAYSKFKKQRDEGNKKTVLQATNGCINCFVIGCALFFIILITAVFTYLAIAVWAWWKPFCAFANGRQCNGRGICVSGVCECFTPYSGDTCADTLVPGYIAATNKECNGNGFVYPFFNMSIFCYQQIVNGEIVGPGWLDPNCQKFVQTVRDRIRENDNNPLLVPESIFIPLCTCRAGFTGESCLDAACPVDNEGRVCGGRPYADNTVGMFSNDTTNANGCRCTAPVFLPNSPVFSALTPAQRGQIALKYRIDFTTETYCAVYIQRNGVWTIYSDPSLYKCVCAPGFAGVLCQNTCPMNPVNKRICYGQGDPKYGQGILKNTKKSINYGVPCDLRCTNGTSKCASGRCSPDQGSVAYYSNGAYCNNPYICPISSPVRCYDGSCRPLPTLQARGCLNRFVTGVIDHGRLDVLNAEYVCQNITSNDTFTACMGTNTSLSGVVSYKESGGIIWNVNDTLTVDLGSPISIIEFSTNWTGVISVTNFNGLGTLTDVIGPTLFSTSFSYDDSQLWINVTDAQEMLMIKDDTGFNLCPVPWNYSGITNIPSNFSLLRLENTQKSLILQVVPDNAFIQTSEYSGTYTYVLVTSPNIGFYLHPIGLEVTKATCLSEPSICSWYTNGTSIRSLDSAFYICSVEGLPVISTTECSDLMSIQSYVEDWITCSTVTPTLDITYTEEIFDIIQRNDTTRTSFPFTIQFLTGTQNHTQILDPLFLTIGRTTFSCACPPDPLTLNRTQLNLLWWDQVSAREIRFDAIAIGDYVLAADFSDGEREFIRGRIVDYSESGNSLLIQNVQSTYEFGAYRDYVRRITPGESLQGWDDVDYWEKPGRCPDGSGSRVSSYIYDLETVCNATLTPPIVRLTCTDAYNFTFPCACNTTRETCFCDQPATPDFELELWDTVDALTTEGCRCIIYTSINTTLSITNDSGIFNIQNDQVPRFISVQTNSSSPEFFVNASSFLFTNLTLNFTFEYIQDTNEWFLTLYTDPNPAFSVIQVSADGLESATLMLSPLAFSLFQTYPPPIFTASSNSANASNVNLLNSSYWMSDTYELAVYIEADVQRYTFPLSSTIIFYKAGNASVLSHFYIQGYNDKEWFTIGGVGAYVEEGGWLEKNVILNATQSYRKYRIVSLGQQFGLRRWDIFTNQLCNCDDESILTMNITSTSNLPTVSELLEEIDYFYEHITPGVTCVAVDNCLIRISPNLTVDLSNDGVCEDLIVIAPMLQYSLQPVTGTTTSFTVEADYYQILQINDELSIVQFVNDTIYFNDADFFLDFIRVYQSGIQTTYTSEEGNETASIIYYFNTETLVVLPYIVVPFPPIIQYVNNSFEFIFTFNGQNTGNLLEIEGACPAGFDYSDCGPSTRNLPLMPGYGCQLTEPQFKLLQDIVNTSVLTNRTLYLSNFTGISYSATFQNISLVRRQLTYRLSDCPIQLCPVDKPIQCINGECVESPLMCDVRYDCPGNGCVEQTDVSEIPTYRCACRPGRNGPGCEYGQCLPATPYERFGIPGSAECTCGGPPPIREKPPVINIGKLYTPELIVQINNKITGNSAPRSALDVDYLRVMPIHAPWGQVIRYRYIYQTSQLSSGLERTIWTTCPFMRSGYFGEYIFLTDDILERNQQTGAVTEWRQYTNPFTGAVQEFVWNNITSYNAFPYRCRNAQCVPDQSFCERSEELYPLCNGRGMCMSDGTCECEPGWRTFSINDAYSLNIRFPYAIVNGEPDPTVWELNWNWKHHGLNQCTARDCNSTDCSAPIGCFPGTPSLNFADRMILCSTSTGNTRICAASKQDCITSSNLQTAVKCFGKGIPRRKDFTGEEYCACGDPISSSLNITAVSQITQLKPNGWGGIACEQYFALAAPILWSPWDFEIDAPYRSLVTGRNLPGKFVSGIRIMGPDPDDRLIWESCCPGYSRLEECPNVPCLIQGEIKCRAASECLTPNTPLVYPCNNHGKARADGTCECDISEADGSGYTYDFSEFSYKGCYKLVQCPVSRTNNAACHFIPACSQPAEWIHPLQYEPYLEQQWFTCGAGGQGLYLNSTKLEYISTDIESFNEQIIASLSSIALEVIAQEGTLASCICVYPDDTISSKTGMLPGASFQYKQNYASPYYLNGSFPSYPSLTSGIIEAIGPNAYYLTPPDTLVFNLENNLTTTLSAVRILSLPLLSASLSVTNSNDEPICGQNILASYSVFLYSWQNIPNSVHRCGPFYTCYSLSFNEPGYAAACPDPSRPTQQCLDWQQSTCTSNPLRVYWPEDSEATYQGCERLSGSGAIPCTCCQRTSTNVNSQISDGIIKVKVVSGSIYIGQVQFYGFANEALTPPTGLVNTISKKYSGAGLSCQDYLFYSTYLGASRDPYAAVPISQSKQQPTTRSSAQESCINTGGFLAIGDSNNLRTVQRQCSLINQDGSRCWLNGRDTAYSELWSPRIDLFQDDCTRCYVPNLQYQSYTYFTFSTYPASPADSLVFKQAMVTGQQDIKQFADTLAENYNTWVYSQKPSASCTVTISYTSSSGYEDESYRQYFKDRGFINPYPNEVYTINQNNLDDYFRTYRFSDYSEQVRWSFVAAYWSTITVSPPNCAEIVLYDPSPNEPTLHTQMRLILTPGQSLPFTKGQRIDADDRLGNNINMVALGIVNTTRMWFRILPYTWGGVTGGVPRLMRYKLNMKTRPNTYNDEGTNPGNRFRYGFDFVPGYNEYRYLPLFLQETAFECLSVFPGATDAGRFDQCRRESWPQTFTAYEPYYITADAFTNTYNNLSDVIKPFPNIYDCSYCLKNLNTFAQFQWNSYLYYETSWPTDASRPSDYSIHIRLPGESNFLSIQNLLTNQDDAYRQRLAAYQVTWIESRTRTQSSSFRSQYNVVPWKLNSCIIVGPNPASPLELSVCDEVLHQYICFYDYIKYSTIKGYMCPPCGDNARQGGEPVPGSTCFDSAPLANATNYPVQNAIKNSYLQGTLEFYAESFSTNIDDIDFTNISIIWGFPGAWTAWKQDLSTRAGQLSRGIQAEQNWCDMSLTINWQIDCGIQRDPVTNSLVRYCASNEEFCNLNSENAPVAPVRDVPPIFDPTLPSFLTSDPTCGFIYNLRGYARTDKNGIYQDQLDDYFVFLSMTEEYVQIQIKETPAFYFNGGKTNTNFKFETNVTGYIYMKYFIQSCIACSSPILDVFIHPLSPLYPFPSLRKTVSVPMVTGQLASFTISFTVSDAESGSRIENGQTFPENVYQGIGFEITGLGVGSSIYLYNPLVTTNSTQALCQNRTRPDWVEPRTRIWSSAPFHKCILTEEDQLDFPGYDIGSCACALNAGGRSCDCPSVVSKYGKAVCGGVGDSGVAVVGWDGEIYSTGEDTEAGCYIIQSTSDCKVIDLARAAYTLLVDGAVWEYPSVFIDRSPADGEGVFVNPPNLEDEWLTESEIQTECYAEAATMPYYLSSDELNQLLQENLGEYPIFVPVTYPSSNALSIQWSEAAALGSYFINASVSDADVISTTAGDYDCSVLVNLCSAINFNNYAYSGTAYPSTINNGKTVESTSSSGNITLAASAPLETTVIGFTASGSAFITCGDTSSCLSSSFSGTIRTSVCRCPTRIFLFDAGFTEIQIFDSGDTTRSSAYNYN